VSSSQNLSAIKEVFITGCPLGIVYFLTYGEWELLSLFAVALGPAEVVTWTIVGYVWSFLKYISDGIADAAESRCAYHLLSNQPSMARSIASKSHFLGLFESLFVTSILFASGMQLAKLITPDPTIQRLMIEVFPLLGIGNVVSTIGLISSSILGAQGQIGMATLIQFLGCWCMTILLGGVFTYGLHVDLQGLTSAFVLGLAFSSAGNTYMLLRSEWDSIASQISLDAAPLAA
jgi:Na+-driven multidrug efflux pump